MSVDIKPKTKLIAKILEIILFFSIFGFFLVTLTYMLPHGRVKQHVSETADAYVAGNRQIITGIRSSAPDHFTDALMLGQAAYASDTPIQAFALNPRTAYGGEETEPPAELSAVYGTLQVSEEFHDVYYGRYWHGYLIFLTPLLEFFNSSQIVVINYAIQFILIVALLLVAYRKYGTKLAIAMAVFVFALNPMITALSFQYAAVFYVTTIASLVIMLFDEKLRVKNRYLYLFTLIGCSINFFDLLTYPFVTLGVPLALVMYIHNDKLKRAKELPKLLKKIIPFSLCWLAGYALTWVLKWTIASIILKQNAFADAINTIFISTGGGDYNRISTLGRNITTMFNVPTLFIIGLIVLVLIFLIIRRKITFKWRPLSIAALAFIALYPFVWYFVLNNHSYIYSFFTHRELAITMFAGALILARSLERVKPNKVTIKAKSKRTK